MKFSIHEEIYKKYAGVKVGVVYAEGILVERTNPKVESFVQNIENEILSDHDIISLDNVSDIITWREIYQSFGSSLKKFSSIEALIRGILENERLYRINSVVDLYNGMSAKYLLPMAAYDADKIIGDIDLRYSKKGEQFTPLGLRQVEKTKAGEVIYADAQKVICRRWNNKDCDQTKITSETTNVVFFMDGAPNVAEDTVQEALVELSSHIQEIFGVSADTALVSPESGQSSCLIL